MAKATGVLEAIEVEPLRVGSMQVWIKGITPLICNRLAAKARRELLAPKGRKSKEGCVELLIGVSRYAGPGSVCRVAVWRVADWRGEFWRS